MRKLPLLGVVLPLYLTSPANAAEVTVYRDKMGVPHVYGDTAPSIYYGAAYAIAQDRLAEGEIFMRSSLGRLAEIMGPALVDADKEARLRVLTQQEVEAQFASLSPEYQAILKAMHAGWRDYVNEVRNDPKKLPFEFKEWGIQPTQWTLWEYLDVMGALQRGYGSGGGGHELTNLAFLRDIKKRFGDKEAAQIFDDVLPLNDPGAVPIIPSELTAKKGSDTSLRTLQPNFSDVQRAQVGTRSGDHKQLVYSARVRPSGASRVFMVGASKSATGNPFMLHATADGPDIHISGAGFNVAGFVLPPICPIIMGRTDTTGFTFTTGESDLVDVFAEKLNPNNRRQYWFNGAWRDMTVRQESIGVKGGESIKLEVEETVHGPVISREDEANVAYSEKNSISGHELAGLAAMIELNRAKDLASYKKAAEAMPFNFNVNYAGVDGHIALYHSGRLPVRSAGIDPRLPTPGTGEYEWRGMVPPDQHPYVVDPKQGFIHAWNNKVTSGSSYGDTSRYGQSFRSWLGVSLANSKDKLTEADLREFNRQMGSSAGGVDLTVTNPKFFTPYLKAAVAGDPKLEAAVAAMEQWNAIYEDLNRDGFYDSPGLPIYREWVQIAQKSIIGDDINDWWQKIDAQNYIKYRTDVLLRAVQGSDAKAPMKHNWFNGTRSATLKKTVADTVSTLAKRYKSTNIADWKQRIFYRYYDASAVKKNPDKPTFPGNDDPRGTTAGRLGLQPANVPANLSEAWNMLIELKPTDTAMYNSSPSGGQNMFISQDGKGNPNISDQVMLHVNYEFKRVPLRRDEVEKVAVSKQALQLPPDIVQARESAR